MADLKITELTAGTPADTDLHVAVDTTDTTMAPTGTDKKYTWSDLKDNVLATAFTANAGEILISDGAGNAPIGDAALVFDTGTSTLITSKFEADAVSILGATSGQVNLTASAVTTNYDITLPAAAPLGNGYVMSFTTTGVASFVPAPSSLGDVVGPASSTDNAIARFDGATGKIIQNSVGSLSDTGALSGLTQLTVDNIDINGNTISSTNTNGNIVLDPNGTGIVSSLANVRSTGGFTMVETGGGSDTITHVAPTNVTTSYRIIEASSIPTAGQVPAVAGVVGTDVSMTWTSVSTPVTSTVTTTWVGIWAAGQAGNLQATTDGTIATLRFPAVSATANTAAVVTNTGSLLPVGLRPAITQVLPVFAFTDNAISFLLGTAVIDTTGLITLSLGQAGIPRVQNGGSFAGAGASGWASFTLSYSLT